MSKLVAERGGVALMPELGYAPVNRYLQPRPRRVGADDAPIGPAQDATPSQGTLARWRERLLKR